MALAAQSGGAMRMTSQPGEGTTVELWLPVSRDVVAVEASGLSMQLGGAMRPCRVLVVDDDPLVIASTAAMLEDLGHSVIEALSGHACPGHAASRAPTSMWWSPTTRCRG